MLLYLLLSATLALWTEAHELKVINSCPYTIWVGTLGNANKPAPKNGGFQLDAGKTATMTVDNGWGGRIWGRTKCDRSGRCETGDCGGKIECKGAGGVPPVTLAEITFDGAGGLDFYDISLVDGYNVPLSMFPTPGTFNNKNPKDQYSCGIASCNANINSQCPNELAQKNSANQVVACKSACLAFNTDQYCCRGSYGNPQTCKPNEWPTNYAAKFKQACPKAYSYAYDDKTSTFTCTGKSSGSSGYTFQFCG